MGRCRDRMCMREKMRMLGLLNVPIVARRETRFLLLELLGADSCCLSYFAGRVCLRQCKHIRNAARKHDEKHSGNKQICSLSSSTQMEATFRRSAYKSRHVQVRRSCIEKWRIYETGAWSGLCCETVISNLGTDFTFTVISASQYYVQGPFSAPLPSMRASCLCHGSAKGRSRTGTTVTGDILRYKRLGSCSCFNLLDSTPCKS